MSLSVIATAVLNNAQADTLKSQPEFRKATSNMIQSYSVIESCLKQLSVEQQAIIKAENFKNVGLVLGTSLGELEVTTDFLVTLANQGMARPILFQNSLHNATLGFLTLHMKMMGPSSTISERFFTAESALQVAELLLQSGEATFALVVCTEVLLKEFEQGYSRLYPAGTELKRGACAFLVTNEGGLKQLGLKPKFTITSIKYDRTPSAPKVLGTYYDSNGLEKIVQNFKHDIILDKPDGSRSFIGIQQTP